MRNRRLLCGLVLMALGGSAANGAIVYSLVGALENGPAPDVIQSDYGPSTTGQHFIINVYLRETRAFGEAPSIGTLYDEGGLYVANIKMHRSAGTGAQMDTVVGNTAGQFDDYPGYGNFGVSNMGADGEITEARCTDLPGRDNRMGGATSNGTTVILDDDGSTSGVISQRVKLGTLDIEITDDSPTTFTIADFDVTAAGDIATWVTPLVLDDAENTNNIVESGQLIFNAAPEPASLSLLALGGLLTLRRRKA